MKTFRLFALVAALGALFISQASATLIYVGTVEQLNDSGTLTQAKTFSETAWGPISGFALLAKDDTSDTTFAPYITLDPGFVEGSSHTYQATWNMSGSGYLLYTVVVKYGRYSDFWVVGDLAQLISGSQLLPTKESQNGISHVSFYGAPGVRIPDGGSSILLLGLGLGMVAWFRRARN